jgi:hypothetical protein
LRKLLGCSFFAALSAAFGAFVSTSLFWRHAARWICSLHISGRLAQGKLIPRWLDVHGLCLASPTHLSSEKPVSGLWGRHFPVSSSQASLVDSLDNLCSRSLIRGNEVRQVLLGPLAHCPHACHEHFNIIPDAEPSGSSAVVYASGLTVSDSAGAHVAGEVRSQHVFLMSPSQSTSAADDSFTCIACAKEGDTAPGLWPSPEDSVPPLGDQIHSPKVVPRSCSDKTSRARKLKRAATTQGMDPFPVGGWAGQPLSHSHCRAAPRKFRGAAVNSALSVNLLHTNLGTICRGMKALDFSIVAISETNAKPGCIEMDAHGVAERGLMVPGGALKFHTLWATMPPGT